MISRKLNKKVEVWNTNIIPDGVGGNLVEEQLLSKSWAYISTKHNSNLATEFGLLDASKIITITTRKRNDLTYDLQTMFIKYRGDNYNIISYPNNVDFKDGFISMMCMKESTKAKDNDLNANLNA